MMLVHCAAGVPQHGPTDAVPGGYSGTLAEHFTRALVDALHQKSVDQEVSVWFPVSRFTGFPVYWFPDKIL